MAKKMKEWLEKATTSEAQRLADLAGTTRNMLYRIGVGYTVRNGYGRDCGPELAAALEKAAAKLRAKNPELPELRRTDLCKVCAACEFAKRCLEHNK